MIRVVRCGSLVGVLMLGLACGTGQPTAPSAAPPPTTTPSPQWPQPLPPGEPVATYAFNGPLDYPVRGFTAGSRYLLYDSGVFALQFDAFAHVYLGRYQTDKDSITFWFDGRWTGNMGTAAAALRGDLLEVRYSDIMQHSDFENAVYRRSR
jgi:hypothetical protein